QWKIIFGLRVRHVPNRTVNSVIEKVFFYVFDDADHCHPRKILIAPESLDSLAERIFSGPRLTRQFFADHNHGQTVGAITNINQPATRRVIATAISAMMRTLSHRRPGAPAPIL